MSLALSSLTLDGATVAFAGVLADVTIRHGRIDVADSPVASSLQVTILDVNKTFARAFHTGASIVLNARDGAGPETPRFTGRVTDGGLDTDDLTIIAIGRLATLSQYLIGAGAWPAETWSARVTRAFSEAGLTAYLELQAAAFNPQLAARDGATEGTVTLADYLGELAATVGAAIVDRPNGKVLIQAIGSRTLASMVVLDPATIVYAPAWIQQLPGTNKATVEYTGGGVTTYQDDASIALYGPRPTDLKTTLSLAADAATRAGELVSRQSFPHWTVPAASLLVGLDLPIGAPMQLTGMPAASPYDPWTPILEGWTDTITSGGDQLEWTMTLALSDPLASGLTLPWNAVPTTAAYQWNTIDPVVAWKDALTLDDLKAG